VPNILRLADSLYTLGNVRIGQKDYDKAFHNFKEAYGIFTEELGERHRLTANCCYRLGWLLNRQKKYNSAM
jgi:tetratricopeptide (TPR) repeat protein